MSNPTPTYVKEAAEEIYLRSRGLDVLPENRKFYSSHNLAEIELIESILLKHIPPPSEAAETCSVGKHKELTDAAISILVERKLQQAIEGWTVTEDDKHLKGQLSAAAASYAMSAGLAIRDGLSEVCCRSSIEPTFWPWDLNWWKPCAPRKMLVKAGAFILAEIERLDRLPQPPAPKGKV